MRWHDLSDDPNDPKVLEERQRALDAATRIVVADRRAYVRQQCAGRRVLDLGCADHRKGAATEPSWLHQQIRGVATSCVGADVNAEAVDRLRGQGLDVHEVDVTQGPGPLAHLEPFDIVVAGEIIEHLTAPLALLTTAGTVLRPGGRLLITTPNPYAPHRVHAGRTGFVWENADHLFYVFPAGLVEMAERTEFRLEAFGTTQWDDWTLNLKQSLYHWRRSLVGRGTSGRPGHRTAWARYTPAPELLALRRQWRRGLMGETAIYLLRKAT